MKELFERLGLDGDGKQEDRMRVLLEWVDARLMPQAEAEMGDRAGEVEGVEVVDADMEVEQQDADMGEPEAGRSMGPETEAPDIRRSMQTETEEPDPQRADLQELTATLKQFMPLLVHGVISPTPQVQVSAPRVQMVEPGAIDSVQRNVDKEKEGALHRRNVKERIPRNRKRLRR